LSTYDIILKNRIEIQLKTWECKFKHYRIGDKVPPLDAERSYTIAANLGDITYAVMHKLPNAFDNIMSQLYFNKKKVLDREPVCLKYGQFDTFVVICDLKISSIEQDWQKVPHPIFSKWGNRLNIEVIKPLHSDLYLYFAEFGEGDPIKAVASGNTNFYIVISSSGIEAAQLILEKVIDSFEVKRLVQPKVKQKGVFAVKVPSFEEQMLDYVYELDKLKTGHKYARHYQETILHILDYLFDDLVDPQLESSTAYQTERRDIIFYNTGTQGFWKDIKEKYGAVHVIFEAKNTDKIRLAFINQLATYLKNALGKFGVIVTRKDINRNVIKKAISVFNSESKIILFLRDRDLKTMVRNKCYRELFPIYEQSFSPTAYMRRIYSRFIQYIQ